MPDGVTIITATGGRTEAFALCRKYVLRQTWRGPVQWIVTDDCDIEAHRDPVIVTEQEANGMQLTVTRLFPRPRWQPGDTTLARNILAAIPHVQHGKVIFFEDDDQYAPDYVEWMAAALDTHEIAGEMHARYYHVGHRAYTICPNTWHASLCATGIRRELLPLLREVCEAPHPHPYLDLFLWKPYELSSKAQRILSTRNVGIKGLPGRRGIGEGHRPESHMKEWIADHDMSTLRKWIGGDVELYRRYANLEVA